MVVAVLMAVVATGLLGARRGLIGSYRQRLAARSVNEAHEGVQPTSVHQGQLRSLQDRVDRLSGDSEKAAAILRQLNTRFADRASRDDLALLQDAITTLNSRASGQAKEVHGYTGDLAEMRSRLNEELKRVSDDAKRMRTELVAIGVQLKNVRADAALMRAEIASVSHNVARYEQRDSSHVKQQPDECFARLKSETDEKVVRVAAYGFDMLKRGDSIAALNALQAAHAWDPSAAEYLYGIALCQFQRGDNIAAQRTVVEAVKAEHLRPTSDWYRRLMATIQGRDRQLLEAVKADPKLHQGVALAPR
jgi:uncharacterized protein (UPF0335 family)